MDGRDHGSGCSAGTLPAAKQLHGKELSYNNINDTNGALELLREFERLSEENNPNSTSFFSKVKSFWDEMKG